MSKDTEETKIHKIEPHRDPKANWEIDVAKSLEEYLLKICSGEVTGDEDDHPSINFAEAALLLQDSVQVYSRKVEYLYTLVLHMWESLSQKRQQDQSEETSGRPEGENSKVVVDDENDPFLGLDDVPLDPKNSLDDGHSKGDTSNLFVKPPSNFVVLEGDCFDSIGDVGELESYLLATHDLYWDFILLDPRDAGVVDKYLEEDKTCRGSNIVHRGSSVRSKACKSAFQSPRRRSGGIAIKSPLGKTLDKTLIGNSQNVEVKDNNIWPDFSAGCDIPENDYHEDGINDGSPEHIDESDNEDDPWKPLNPHEVGNLKVKPFKKGRNLRRQKTISTKLMSLASQFPVARLHSTINPEYNEIWEKQLHEVEKGQDNQSPSLYEKLRQSLDIGGNESCYGFSIPGEDNDDNEDENDIPDFAEADFTMPESTFMDAEGPLNHEMHDGDVHFGNNDIPEPEVPQSEDPTDLEYLVRKDMDAIDKGWNDPESQNELAKRVSTWKMNIEEGLKLEQERGAFDIHAYGEEVLDKLCKQGESGSGMSFADVVKGKEKHDVARTFSALLQLVNNRSVDLDKGKSSGQPVCYTAVNPFYLRLVTQAKRPEDLKFRSKKRGKSPMVNSEFKAARKKSFD